MNTRAQFSPVDVETAQTMSAPEAISYHYDNETDFFALWLDPTLSYSCARWRDPQRPQEMAKDLAEAQRAKIAYHLDAVRLPPGGRLLDVGCGWGAALAATVARDPGATALGLTLSNDQHTHIKSSAVPGVDVMLRDIFAFEAEQPFQGALSIGAFEHFARPQMDRSEKLAIYATLFEKLAGMLEPEARFSLQTIVWDAVSFEEGKELLPQTVFPQSDLPYIDEIVEASHGHFRLAYMENDPGEYVRTLSAWIKNLRAVRDTVNSRYGAEKYAFFEDYLRRSRLAFRQGYNSLARFVLVRR
ncbi:MAG: class I SAM-dependent methyltransferase [Pseudomonadota bacterium]